MDVIDRYFQTLRLFLPKNQRDDIIHELAEEIRAQAADKEVHLGRPLTSDDQRALIAHFPHPLLMAGRYWPQRHLVGPALYPFYWPVLKVGIALVVAIHVIAGLVLIVTGTPWDEAARRSAAAWNAALAVFAWTTLAFWLVDRHLTGGGALGRETPARPDVASPATGVHDVASRAVETARAAVHEVERAVTPSPQAHLLVHVVIAGWWLLALKIPVLMFGPAATVIGFAPVWDRFYPLIVVLTLLQLVREYVQLSRPHLKASLATLRVASMSVGLVLLYFLLRAGEWVVFRGTGDARARFNVLIDLAGRQMALIELVNYAIASVLIGVAIISALGMIHGVRSPTRAERGSHWRVSAVPPRPK